MRCRATGALRHGLPFTAWVRGVLQHAEPNRAARKKLMVTATRALERMLDENWLLICHVGEALRQRSTLTGDEIDQILQPVSMPLAA